MSFIHFILNLYCTNWQKIKQSPSRNFLRLLRLQMDNADAEYLDPTLKIANSAPTAQCGPSPLRSIRSRKLGNFLQFDASISTSESQLGPAESTTEWQFEPESVKTKVAEILKQLPLHIFPICLIFGGLAFKKFSDPKIDFNLGLNTEKGIV